MYHDVNCTKCGRKTSAVNMAINMDELIKIYLKREKEKNRENNIYETMLGFFSNICFGLYFSFYDLKSEKYLGEENELKLSGSDIMYLLWQKHLTKEERENIEDDEAILDILTEAMDTAGDVEVDWQKKRKEIEKILDFLSENKESIFLKCRIEPRREKDDMGNTVMTGINATFAHRDGNKDGLPLVCPDCGTAFLADAGKYHEEVILLMGSARVGKTAYLAALIDYLNGDNAKKLIFPLQIGPLTDKRGLYFQENVLNVYQKGQKIQKTNTSNEEIVPLVSFLLRIRNDKLIIVTFVDMPGEAYVPEEEQNQKEEKGFIANKRRISKNASAYIFCIAPEQIDLPIKEGEKNKPDSAKADIEDVLRNIGNTVKNMNEESVFIPTAVVITKNDKLKDYNFYNPEEKYEDLIREEKYFMTDKYRTITDEIREYLQAGHVAPIEQKLRFISKRYNFFTVASYGTSIEEGKCQKMPSGITLPFLWILTMLGYFIPAHSEYVREKEGLFSRKYNVVERLAEQGCEALVQIEGERL